MILAIPSLCVYFEYMNTSREDAIRKALELNPGSLRHLAIEAGVSPALLRFIQAGERTATAPTVEKVADALERWTERTSEAARILREALNGEEEGS